MATMHILVPPPWVGAKMDESSIYGKFHWTHKSDFFNFSIGVPIHKKKSRYEIAIITETGKTLERNDTICDSLSLFSFKAECTERSPMPILRHIAPPSNQRHHLLGVPFLNVVISSFWSSASHLLQSPTMDIFAR